MELQQRWSSWISHTENTMRGQPCGSRCFFSIDFRKAVSFLVTIVLKRNGCVSPITACTKPGSPWPPFLKGWFPSFTIILVGVYHHPKGFPPFLKWWQRLPGQIKTPLGLQSRLKGRHWGAVGIRWFPWCPCHPVAFPVIPQRQADRMTEKTVRSCFQKYLMASGWLCAYSWVLVFALDPFRLHGKPYLYWLIVRLLQMMAYHSQRITWLLPKQLSMWVGLVDLFFCIP